MNEMREVRCPQCSRLLFRVAGLGCVVEIQCWHPDCKTLVRWPTLVAEVVARADRRNHGRREVETPTFAPT